MVFSYEAIMEKRNALRLLATCRPGLRGLTTFSLMSGEEPARMVMSQNPLTFLR